MKMHENLIQGSQEWLDVRCGIITASCIGKVLAKGEGKTRADYMNELIAERITGIPTSHFTSADMERGKEQEPIAVSLYEDRNGVKARNVGFIETEIGGYRVGCSPDRLVGEDGGIEVKGRLAKLQVQTMRAGKIPAEFIKQIQFCLLVSGRSWWDFVSHAWDMPPFERRAEPDEKLHQEMKSEVVAFYQEMEEVMKQIGVA